MLEHDKLELQALAHLLLHFPRGGGKIATNYQLVDDYEFSVARFLTRAFKLRIDRVVRSKRPGQRKRLPSFAVARIGISTFPAPGAFNATSI